MTPRQLAAWQAKRDRSHLYEYEPAARRYIVREPGIAGGGIVCTLAGDPTAAGTHLQADAICRALDRLAAKTGSLEDHQ